MSIDIVDDLHAAEDRIAELEALILSLDAVVLDATTASDVIARDGLVRIPARAARRLHREAETVGWCRPSCDDGCADDCGCPCHIEDGAS